MKFTAGGDKRIRTADICRAKATLYQLSYIPNWLINNTIFVLKNKKKFFIFIIYFVKCQ